MPSWQIRFHCFLCCSIIDSSFFWFPSLFSLFQMWPTVCEPISNQKIDFFSSTWRGRNVAVSQLMVSFLNMDLLWIWTSSPLWQPWTSTHLLGSRRGSRRSSPCPRRPPWRCRPPWRTSGRRAAPNHYFFALMCAVWQENSFCNIWCKIGILEAWSRCVQRSRNVYTGTH